MLVFSRKSGERMWISDNVEVTVLGIHGNTVWLGFTAPPGVAVERADTEVYADKQTECKQAEYCDADETRRMAAPQLQS